MNTKKLAKWLIFLIFLLSACNISHPRATSLVTPTQAKQVPEKSASTAVTPAPTVAGTSTAAVLPSPTVIVIPTASPTAEPASLAPSYIQLQTYRGAGFSFQYPANAQVKINAPTAPVLSQVDILGPDIFIKPGDADWVYQGHGYQITVRTYSNPNSLDVEAWAKDYFQNLSKMSQGGPDQSPETQNRSVVAGYPAYKASFFGGDSDIWVYYLANKDQIIALSFNEYPVENQPIARVQQDIDVLILGTIQIEGTPKSMPSERLQSYQDPAFSFQYPANAQVKRVTPESGALNEVQVKGPDISIKPGDATWTFQDHGYQLTVQTYDNPKNLDVETWARTYLLASWKAQAGHYAGPVLDSGKIDEGRVGKTTIAGYPAFWANFFAGDSSSQVFYLANNEKVVALSFRDYPAANQPITQVQQDIAALLMGTFRFNNGASVPQYGKWQACDSGIMSRLTVGNRSYVSTNPPVANLVREKPIKNAQVLGQIEPGAEMVIIDGPSCSGGMTWWKVRAVKDGLTGWTAEGDANTYWLIPK